MTASFTPKNTIHIFTAIKLQISDILIRVSDINDVIKIHPAKTGTPSL
jgi:hypothetical protein